MGVDVHRVVVLAGRGRRDTPDHGDGLPGGQNDLPEAPRTSGTDVLPGVVPRLRRLRAVRVVHDQALERLEFAGPGDTAQESGTRDGSASAETLPAFSSTVISQRRSASVGACSAENELPPCVEPTRSRLRRRGEGGVVATAVDSGPIAFGQWRRTPLSRSRNPPHRNAVRYSRSRSGPLFRTVRPHRAVNHRSWYSKSGRVWHGRCPGRVIEMRSRRGGKSTQRVPEAELVADATVPACP